LAGKNRKEVYTLVEKNRKTVYTFAEKEPETVYANWPKRTGKQSAL
jgi:hypothetical protein